MLANFKVKAVDMAAGFIILNITFENGISTDYNVAVESIAAGTDATLDMIKAAIKDVASHIAKAAFPPEPTQVTVLPDVLDWMDEVVY
jgi:hypothetical protein